MDGISNWIRKRTRIPDACGATVTGRSRFEPIHQPGRLSSWSRLGSRGQGMSSPRLPAQPRAATSEPTGLRPSLPKDLVLVRLVIAAITTDPSRNVSVPFSSCASAVRHSPASRLNSLTNTSPVVLHIAEVNAVCGLRGPASAG